jgi:eukaryotic-like serine/threonine-protein kinase
MIESDAEHEPDWLSAALLGSSVGDRYRLEQTLGKGGMGEVFLAVDTRLNKQVALKVLSPGLVNSAAARQRFKRECAICAALKSPHIVQVSDYGITESGHPFYVMEYLQGETLSQLLARNQYLSVEQTCRIGMQICAGLQVAHRGVMLQDPDYQTSRLIKVIHRDLKPDNIFLIPTALGELVKIIDFGIAKIRDLQTDTAEVTQSLLGTSHYAAPEQFEIAELDERTDIYSLGMMLYEMLAGTDPYGLDFKHHSVSNTAWLTAHLTKAPLPLRSQPTCDQLSPALEATVMRCLAKSPAERFSSVEALNQALEAAVTDVLPRNISVDSPANFTQNSRHREYSFLLYAVLLPVSLAIAATMGLSYFLRSTSVQQPIQAENPAENRSGFSLTRTILGHQAAVWSLALSTDGNTLISGDEAGVVKIWDLRTGQLSRTLAEKTSSDLIGAVRSLSLSPDNQLLVSGGNQIQLWEVSTGKLRAQYPQSVWSVALGTDGRTLVSGSEDRQVRIWDLQQGQFRSLSGHEGSVYAVAISPDQRFVISGSGDRTVKVWDRRAGTVLNTFTGHRDAVRCLALSADGRLLASGSWDQTIKLWNLQTNTLIHTLQGHSDRVVAVKFSQDGQLLASASTDGTIKIWQVQTGKLLHRLVGHTDWVLSVEMSHDRQTVVSGSKDKTIKIWQ